MSVLVKALKGGALVLAGILWCFGLADQLHSLELTARYLLLSGAMVAVATL